jgi:hypothetical protein
LIGSVGSFSQQDRFAAQQEGGLPLCDAQHGLGAGVEQQQVPLRTCSGGQPHALPHADLAATAGTGNPVATTRCASTSTTPTTLRRAGSRRVMVRVVITVRVTRGVGPSPQYARDDQSSTE